MAGVDVVVIGCEHNNVEWFETGGLHFTDGEVWDDIEEHAYCLDCCSGVQLYPPPEPRWYERMPHFWEA